MLRLGVATAAVRLRRRLRLRAQVGVEERDDPPARVVGGGLVVSDPDDPQQSGQQVVVVVEERVPELSPVASRPSPAGRTLVISRTPIYNGRWLRQARQFLKRNRGVLEATSLAVFGMGAREATEEAFRRSRAQLERSLAGVPWARSVWIGVFGGVDPPRRHPRRDARDWGVIEAWCKDLAAAVRPVPAAPG